VLTLILILILTHYREQVLALHPTDYDKGEDSYVWPRFWSMPVIALILITLLNDGTIISIAYDHVSLLLLSYSMCFVQHLH
jgi:hypothetical protein